MEKICINCSAYFPVPPEELTEFGICLNDEVFEPFIDEIMEGLIPASCSAIVEKEKFVGDRPGCPNFEEPEIIEIDDDSPLGQELARLRESGKLTPEALENAINEEHIRRAELKTLPMDRYAKQLESKQSRERDAGISSFGAMIALGSTSAFRVLLRFLSSLPPPATIKDVHLKREILRHLDFWQDKSAVAPILLKDLGRIHSDNTTRQWISDIFKFLEQCPLEIIQGPLEKILSDKRFSYKFRRRVIDTLSRSRKGLKYMTG